MRRSFAIIPMIAILLASPALGGDYAGARDPEDIRQDLYDFVGNQERLLNTIEQIQPVTPHLRRSISTQMQLVKSLTPQELMMLGQSNLPLAQVNSEFSSATANLEQSMSKYNLSAMQMANVKAYAPSGGMNQHHADPAPGTAGAPHLGGGCPASGKIGVGGFAPVFNPPGYCNQIDDVPVATTDANGNTVFVEQEFRLSDVSYPFICPINIPHEAVFILETATMIVKAINDVTDNACQQEGGGFNGSVACVVVVLGLRLAEDLLEQSTECNNERRDSEGTTIYARTGEVFVQSDAHYKSLLATDKLIKDAVTVLNTNIGGRVFKMGNEVTAELNVGFGDIATQIDIVEQRILLNATKGDFVRMNDEVIEYKIWCDDQRPTLRPSNCP